MKIKTPQISFFQACILFFLAIITACAVCSTVAVVRSANRPAEKTCSISGKSEKDNKGASSDLSVELKNINRSIKEVSSGLVEIDRQLGYLYNKIGTGSESGASNSAEALAGVTSELNEICKVLHSINTTLVMMGR